MTVEKEGEGAEEHHQEAYWSSPQELARILEVRYPDVAGSRAQSLGDPPLSNDD